MTPSVYSVLMSWINPKHLQLCYTLLLRESHGKFLDVTTEGSAPRIEWWNFTQYITLRMEWDIKEICLGHTPTRAQRTNQCPTSILYSGFIIPCNSSNNNLSRELWKMAIGKEISLHSALLILEAGTLPESGCWKAPSITADLTWQNDQWLHWAEKSAHAWDVFSNIPQPYSSPCNSGTQEEILLFVCVCSRDFKRETKEWGGQKREELRQSWSLSCKVMTKLLPFCHHVFILKDYKLAGEWPFFCLLCMSIVSDIIKHLFKASQCFCNTDNMQS